MNIITFIEDDELYTIIAEHPISRIKIPIFKTNLYSLYLHMSSLNNQSKQYLETSILSTNTGYQKFIMDLSITINVMSITLLVASKLGLKGIYFEPLNGMKILGQDKSERELIDTLKKQSLTEEHINRLNQLILPILQQTLLIEMNNRNQNNLNLIIKQIKQQLPQHVINNLQNKYYLK